MSRILSLVIVLSAIVICISGCSSLESGSVNNVGSEDQVIVAHIQQRLEANNATRYAMVHVKSEYGFVTVYGRKPDPGVEDYIISIIKNTPGVKGVETTY